MKQKWTAMVAVGALSTLMALAADQPASPPRDDSGPPRGRGPGGRGGGMMGLDDQQRQLFQQALQKENDKLRGLEGKLRTAQKDLLETTLASTYDEKAVRGKAEALAAIQVEITTVRAKALATVVPTLKPEQKQQVIESPFGVMLLNGGPGGGRPPGAQGGGPDGFPAGGRDQRPKER